MNQSMKPVRVGVVGAGVIGKKHVGLTRDLEHVDVIGITDLNREAAEAVAEEHEGVGVYDSLDAMLADDRIEAVVLALPTGVRFEPAKQVVNAGRHLLLEKPPAMNAGQLRELLQLRGDLKVGCCSIRHTQMNCVAKAKAMIEGGELGTLRTVRCRAVNKAGPDPKKTPPVWRLRYDLNGGGIMANWGVYDLDFLLSCAGDAVKPETVFGQTWQIGKPFEAHAAPGSDAETHATALVRCADGVVLTFDRAERAAVGQNTNEWEFIGEAGSLRIDMLPGEHLQMHHTYPDKETGVKTECLSDETYMWDDAHAAPLKDLCAAIREDRPPHTSLERAIVIQQLIDGIYESARSGEAVRIG